MINGYVIASITVTDPECYQIYKDVAPGVIAAFSGRYLVKAPKVDTVEGRAPLGKRFVNLEFDSLKQSQCFYHSDEYQKIAADRKAASLSDFHIMEGCLIHCSMAGRRAAKDRLSM